MRWKFLQARPPPALANSVMTGMVSHNLFYSADLVVITFLNKLRCYCLFFLISLQLCTEELQLGENAVGCWITACILLFLLFLVHRKVPILLNCDCEAYVQNVWSWVYQHQERASKLCYVNFVSNVNNLNDMTTWHSFKAFSRKTRLSWYQSDSIPNFIGPKDDTDDGDKVTTGAITRAKLQSNRRHQ